MEFRPTQEQEDVRKLATEILDDLARPENLPDIEEAVEWYDEALWSALAKAGLLGVAVPEAYGGMGFGILELGTLVECFGRAVAPVPALPTLVTAAETVREFGNDEQKERLLPGVCDGSILLGAALIDEGAVTPGETTTRARADGNGYRLDGVKQCVEIAERAERIVVAATDADGHTVVCLVDPRADGVRTEAQQVTTGEKRYRLTLADAAVAAADVVADGQDGAAVLEWLLQRTLAGMVAMELGIAARALEMTATYAGEREQFGKAIGTFQAVGQRAADAFIDVEAIRLSAWQGLWKLSRGMDARRELEIAKFWASEGGHRACYAAQHLHGGIGVDTDYPLHRYYMVSKQLELTLGGAAEQLAARGRALAAG